MDIEAIVKKHLKQDGWSFSRDGECAEAIRAALTEAESCMAMEHNLKMLQVEAAHAIELRAYEATVANQAERIRQLEVERVPDAVELLEIIVRNAELQADARMDGTTDCYAVPLDDIDRARDLLAPQPKESDK